MKTKGLNLFFIATLQLFLFQSCTAQQPMCSTVGATTTADAWGECDLTFLNTAVNPVWTGKHFEAEAVVYNSIQGDDDAHGAKVNILMPLEAKILRVYVVETPGERPVNESGSCHSFILDLGHLNRTEPGRDDFKEKKRTIRVVFTLEHPRVRFATMGMFAYPSSPSDNNPANNYVSGSVPVTTVSASN